MATKKGYDFDSMKKEKPNGKSKGDDKKKGGKKK
jgi:hypothetical protein